MRYAERKFYTAGETLVYTYLYVYDDVYVSTGDLEMSHIHIYIYCTVRLQAIVIAIDTGVYTLMHKRQSGKYAQR